MTTTEELLRASLRARADRTTYEPTSVLEVAARARRLRRQRTRTSLLAVAAAVAAVAVPLGVVLGADDSGPQPAPAPSKITNISSFSALPRGAAPQVDYVDEATYVAANGGRTRLPVRGWDLSAVAPYRGGFLLTTLRNEQGADADVSWVDSGGAIQWTRCGSHRLAVSEDGRIISYSSVADCMWRRPLLTWGAAEGTVDVALNTTGLQVDPVAVTDQFMLYNVWAPPPPLGKCCPATPAPAQEPSVFVTALDSVPEEVPGLVAAADLDEATGRVAGTNQDGLGVVVDIDTGAVRAELGEERYPLAFSPDGRYVLVTIRSASNPRALAVHDATTGTEMLTVRLNSGIGADTSAVAWEDDAHVLVGARSKTRQAIIRIGLDGSAEVAEMASRRAGELLRGFQFPAGS